MVYYAKNVIDNNVDSESNNKNYKNIADILIIGTGFKVDQNIPKPIDVKSVEKLIKMIKLFLLIFKCLKITSIS